MTRGSRPRPCAEVGCLHRIQDGQTPDVPPGLTLPAGYAFYEITRNGETLQAGYGVAAECEDSRCTSQIDRGLAHLCGETPGGDEYGCGGYFCSRHLFMAPADEERTGQRCARCLPELDDDARRIRSSM